MCASCINMCVLGKNPCDKILARLNKLYPLHKNMTDSTVFVGNKIADFWLGLFKEASTKIQNLHQAEHSVHSNHKPLFQFLGSLIAVSHLKLFPWTQALRMNGISALLLWDCTFPHSDAKENLQARVASDIPLLILTITSRVIWLTMFQPTFQRARTKSGFSFLKITWRSFA